VPQDEADESETDGVDPVPNSKTSGGAKKKGPPATTGGEPKKGDGQGGANTDVEPSNTPKKTTTTGVPLRDVRAVPLTPTRRKVAFTPAVSGEMCVELQDSGADANYMLDATSSSAGTVSAGRIEGLMVKAGQRVMIEVELKHNFAGTLRVVANAV
jgi:hypothetical protein